VGNWKKYDFRVHSSGITSIPNFIQICRAVLQLNHADRQTDMTSTVCVISCSSCKYRIKITMGAHLSFSVCRVDRKSHGRLSISLPRCNKHFCLSRNKGYPAVSHSQNFDIWSMSDACSVWWCLMQEWDMIRTCTFGFHKRRGISCLAWRLLASQEGFCFMKLVCSGFCLRLCTKIS
jgi:hypothetical protein